MDRRYWDSDCFLGFLQAESDKEALCRAVLGDAEQGNVMIVTSALTIAEVLRLRGRTPLPKAVRQKVTDFFRNEYISIRNVTRRIAENARDLVWDNGIHPKDAIHVATALDARLSLMNTFDGDLIKKSAQLGRPPLLIGKPQPPIQTELF
jgi:predicted nucleic acid-binding protein